VNSYLWIHRIKGPAMLLVFGITALLDEWDIISYGKSWPLYLIVFGVLQLAERAAWTQYQQAMAAQYDPQGAPYPAYGAAPAQPYPGQPYPGQAYPGQTYPGQPYPGQPYPPAANPSNPGTALIVPPPSDLERR
jgi:hypothetical protein